MKPETNDVTLSTCVNGTLAELAKADALRRGIPEKQWRSRWLRLAVAHMVGRPDLVRTGRRGGDRRSPAAKRAARK